MVNVWESDTGMMIHRLGGHHGSVNETAFHPKRNLLASGSSDKTIYLGELTK